MRQLKGRLRLPLFYVALDKAATQKMQHTPVSNQRVIIVPSRPQVTILPSTDPYQQLPSLFISLLALVIALYSLKKNLAQKRDEHRAKFFHDVVVDNGLVPVLRFFEQLQRFSERESAKLIKSAGMNGHDVRVKEVMRKVREMKRSAATRICGLVSPFSVELERQIQFIFDEAADAANQYLEIYASGSTTAEPIGRALATCQRNIIELLREHEFELGWPRFLDSIRHKWSGLLSKRNIGS
ncbi:MAG: hypothetical protein WCC04_20600 [Terriglobales bacterium]